MYRDFLHQDVQLLATALCELSQFEEAVQAVELLDSDGIGNSSSELEVAAIWCTISSATESEMQVSPSFHQTFVTELDQRALSRILQAVENGTLSEDQLKDPRFKRLRRYESSPDLPNEDEEEVPGD